jgi:hypothetical protein
MPSWMKDGGQLARALVERAVKQDRTWNLARALPAALRDDTDASNALASADCQFAVCVPRASMC